MSSNGIPTSERSMLAPFFGGAVGGACAGLVDALTGGALAGGLVPLYAAAMGAVFGALLGLGYGGLSRAASGRGGTRSRADVGARRTVVGIALAILVLALPVLGRVFATAFRNRELAALTLVAAALGVLFFGVLIGAAARGLLERFLERLPSERRERASERFGLAALAFAGLAVMAALALHRGVIDAEDARGAAVLGVFLVVTAAATAALRRRRSAAAAWPWIARRAGLVLGVVAVYASYQVLTGSAPTAVAAASTSLAVTALAFPDKGEAAPRIAAARAPRGRAVAAAAPAKLLAAAPPPTSKGAAASPAPRPPILLVTLSSTRADRLSLYGYGRPTSPKLAAFAKGCAVFERAYAASSSERDALPSILTGRLPTQLRRTSTRWPRLRAGNGRLAKALARAGYHTEAVVTHDGLRAASGLGVGFARYDTELARPGERRALSTITSPEVVKKARAALERAPADKPFLVWAHFSDPHGRYVRHEGVELGPRMADRYDGELAFMDGHLGELLDAAARSPRKPWIVIVGDHGEALGDEGGYGHGRSLRDAEVRVPLVICGEGVRARRFGAPASVLDLHPTLLALAGVEAPKTLPGRSLVPVLLGGAPADETRAVPLELTSPSGRLVAAALVSGHEKLVSRGSGRHPRLFDLRADPRERRNVAHRRGDRVRKLQIALQRLRFPSLAAGAPTGRKRRGFVSATEDAAEKEALKRTQRRQRQMWEMPE